MHNIRVCVGALIFHIENDDFLLLLLLIYYSSNLHFNIKFNGIPVGSTHKSTIQMCASISNKSAF